jgi:hypothetical protein
VSVRTEDVALPATFFVVGSTLFSWLLLRGRMIPIPLAWLGVVASVLLVVCLPLTTRGIPSRADCDADVVADVGVRSAAGALATHQGRRHADPRDSGVIACA